VRILAVAVIAAAALVAAAPVFAAQAISVSVEELARTSDAVVRGRVARAQSEQTADGMRIFTRFEVRTSAVLRGKAPASAFVVVPGGVVGRIGQRVDAAPTLTLGEEIVLFLQRSSDDTFVVTALAQGKFSVFGTVARPDLSNLTFVGTSVRPGERRVEDMPVAELERRVRSTK
jgi:hypothetical protein